jgi:gliding motility-associated-like protein
MITIYDSQGCSNDTSISIYGDSDYDIDVVIDQPASNPICLGDSVYLEADYISSNADSAMWDPLDDGLYPVGELETIGLQPEYSEEYLLIATKGYCANIDTLDLQIHPPLRFTIDENDDEQDGKINILETEDSYDIPLILDTDTVQAQFSWNPADYFVYDLTTNMSPDNRLLVDELKNNEIAEQEIKVQASTLYGCIEKDSATVVIVPNVEPLDAFTPNGDGYNDKWLIRYAEQYPELEVAVFNRWGVEIFRRKPYTNENGWNGKNSNGKDLPSGTYYYLIDTHETGVSALTGTVTIVR